MDPAAFLAASPGDVRGFWGRGDRWLAWAGEIGRIEVRDRLASSRFERVRHEAHRILGGERAAWRDMPPSQRPRFFGGFAFLDRPADDPVWRGFPAACFVLPRLILEGRPGGCRLRVQGLGEGGASGMADGDGEELTRMADTLPTGEGLAGLPGREARASVPDAALTSFEGGVRTAAALERDRWNGAVRVVLGEVGKGSLRKVVLSRTLDAELAACDPLLALRFLRRENPRAHVFLFEPRPGRVFLGAAPEILAELRGGRFEATAVAGSVGRGATDEADLALARRLRESAKDRSEHLFTAEEMAEVLAPRLVDMEVESEPRVLRLARIQHLETAIRGRTPNGADVLSLVEALHPTPAVCGRPREAALELIRGAEPFDRGWYAGPVGWFDPAGDGDFVPALRSAVGDGTRWRLFAGAGIVEGSDPDAEWEETALKFEPALRALAAGSEGGEDAAAPSGLRWPNQANRDADTRSSG